MAKLNSGSLLLALVGLVLLAPAGLIIFTLVSDGGFIGLIPMFMLLASAASGAACLFLAFRGIER